MSMKASGWRSRHRILLGSATTAAVAALIAVGVPALALSSNPATSAAINARGGGYPPPGGIYKGFTNCPVKNPLMSQSNSFTACTLGDATSGSITLGNITTPVTQAVNVQFGFYENTNQPYYADVVPPPAGISTQLVTKPDLIPQSLTTALGCATATDPTVQSICQQAASRGGAYNQVFALAESAGAITNFNLLSWTQPVMFKLINPLLGNSCTIGTFGNPVVLNPALSVGPGGMLTLTNDPNPARNPDTFVLAITQAVAGDNTFSAPGVTNCGPGGPANIAVGAALDAGTGLPAASGNSLALNGSFQVAATEASGDPAVAQPAYHAAILLNAFKYSTRNSHGQKISMATFKHMLKHG
jgi:hypothetical protein